MKRRIFLRTTVTAMHMPLALSLGLLKSNKVLATWPSDAFHSTKLEDALTRLFGPTPLTPSDAVEIQARNIAEDGSSVPVGIRSRIPGTRSITLLSEKNPKPAVARFTVGPRVEAFVNTRIKMGGTGHLIAVAEAEGRHYVAKKSIKVTAGGCAG